MSQPGSPAFAPIFASASVSEVFSDRALVQAMLDFEAALTEAEAELALVPATCVAAIRSACDVDLYDLAALGLPLAEIAKGEPAIAGNISDEETETALDPARYLGSAEVMIDAALEDARRETETP